MAAINFAEYLGIEPRFVDSTFIGGASNVAHLHMASVLIHARVCETVLVSYGMTPRQGEHVALTPEYADDFERTFGVCFPVGLYALCVQRHMHQCRTTREQFARLVVASRQWAALNPRAARRGTITVEEVIASPPIVSPIHRLDACLVSDAGGAFVVTSEERARDLAAAPVALLGAGHAFTHRSIAQREDITTTGAVESARRAYEVSGIGRRNRLLVRHRREADREGVLFSGALRHRDRRTGRGDPDAFTRR